MEKTQHGEPVSKEVKRQLWLAGPLIAGSLMQNLIQMISIMFVGHLGELPLAGASMATSFATVTGFSLLAGMAGALDTLCGQAFGAREYHLLGIYKQRAMLLLTLVCIPVAVLWYNTGEILLVFGQDPGIAMEAGTYARWMIPGLFAYGVLQCHVRFLQSQNMALPVMASAGAAALFHLLVCWLLVHAAGMGGKGAALSNAVSYWVYVILLAVYVRASSSCEKTWTGFSTEAFRGARDFFRLAVPSALMLCLEWWSFEILVLLSGLLPNPKLETSVLSITTRVSNELGAGRPKAARLAVRVVVFLAISEGLAMGVVLVCVRYIWGHAYSDEEEVVAYVAKMLLLISVANFLDGIQCVLSGVARGCGWQKIGVYINLGAFYVIGVPAAYSSAGWAFGWESFAASWCRSCYWSPSHCAPTATRRQRRRRTEYIVLPFQLISQLEDMTSLGSWFLVDRGKSLSGLRHRRGDFCRCYPSPLTSRVWENPTTCPENNVVIVVVLPEGVAWYVTFLITRSMIGHLREAQRL